jgi:peptide/nickel transport system substrate-binding protein
LTAQAGAFAGTPSDQYLSPGMPGYVDANIYPLGGDLVAAAALAASQGVTPATPVSIVLYTSTNGALPAIAAIIQQTLAQIGFNVTIQAFSRAEQIGHEGTRGEPFDMTTEGWLLDYNDPFDVINVLLDGRNIRPTNNNNVSYFNDPAFSARMDAAEQLTGQARYDAYASLEHDLVRAAPLVAYRTFNSRDYFSDRIGCQAFGSFGMSLGDLCIH